MLLFWIWIPAAGAKGKSSKEIHFRLVPQTGILFKTGGGRLQDSLRSVIFVAPEASLEFQITNHWFGVLNFAYAQLRGKRVGGVTDNANMYGPTLGFKIVSDTNDASTGDFFDDTRWWFTLQAGPYVTDYQSQGLGLARLVETQIGANSGIGFDYFFKTNWGIGLQAKFHYVYYSRDDYILFTAGPSLTLRF